MISSPWSLWGIVFRLAWPAAAASYASGYCTSGGCGVWNPWRLLGAGWAWKRPGSFKQARQTHELCARADPRSQLSADLSGQGVISRSIKPLRGRQEGEDRGFEAVMDGLGDNCKHSSAYNDYVDLDQISFTNGWLKRKSSSHYF